ncbi:MAG: alpha-glucan family phosphorylase [bacterium]
MTAQPRYALPTVPEALKGLGDLALDMRWSWSHSADELWQRLAPELWETTHNPWHILQTIAQTRLEEFAADPEFLRLVERHLEAWRETLDAPSWFEQTSSATVPRRSEVSDGDSLVAGAAEAQPPLPAGAGPAAPPTLGATAAQAAARPAAPLTAPLGPVAYFSMEFGLSEALPIYSGGLGILAGDFLKASSDLGVPLVGVGLLWQQGYFRQMLDSHGDQIEFFPFNDPGQLPIMPLRDSEGEWLGVTLQFPRRTVRVRVWEVRAGRVKLYLLDANDLVNSPADRGLTSELYGGGPEMRLQQEMILGIGGWRVLRELGIEPDVCHLNEGHAALAVLERARCYMRDWGVTFEVALTATRAGNLFTTHTPVEAGFDRFPPALVSEYLGAYADELGIGMERLLALGQCPDSEPFNMAYLAIRGSGAVNAVSRLHGEVSRGLFQPLFPRWPHREVPVGHVTNGVHVPSWDSEEADALWTKACGKGRWLDGLEGLGDLIRQVGDEELWAFRDANRRKLIAVAREHVTRQGPVAGSLETLGSDITCLCDPAVLTLGFARRFTSYKRVDLLLHDPARLERILCGDQSKVQLVLAGKAHPADTAGKAMIREWTQFISRCDVRPHVIFLVDYDMGIAEHLVHGADVWINTPRRPWEASGTSGMKVLVNGGLNLSELDGWWAEAYSPDVGWALGDGLEHGADPAWDAIEAERLYDLLENEIIPEFYDRDEQGIPRRWIARVRESMARLTPQYSTNRMLKEYLEKYYLPAAAAYRARSATAEPRDGATVDAAAGDAMTSRSPASPAAAIEAWRTMLAEHWNEIEFVDFGAGPNVGPQGNTYVFTVKVKLGSVPPDSVRVELYAEPIDYATPEEDGRPPVSGAAPPERHLLTPLSGASGNSGTSKKDVSSPTTYTYTAVLPATRPLGDYTPRVVPWHTAALVPLEADRILWYR